MKYKLLIIKNRTTEKTNLKTYLDWFKINTPIEIVTEEISTDFDVISQTVGNGSFSGVICSEDIIPKLKTVVSEGKYNAVVLYVGNNLNGIRVSVCNGKDGKFNLYPDTELIQLRTIDDGGKDLNHELPHSFFAKLRRNGINLTDPMDTYILNNEMVVDSVINTNREMALQLLKPYWDKICAFKNVNNNTMTTYLNLKNFSQKEQDKFKLTKELWFILDKIRDLSGIPIIGTSGFRTVAENTKIGGVYNSSHLKGLGFDWLCTDNKKRTLFVRASLNCGTPIFLEIAKSHLHIDIDSSIHSLGQTIPSNDD